jgi:hypothetical protein
MATIIDSYSESNYDASNTYYYNSGIFGSGQSFTGDGNPIISCQFYLKKTNSPAGTLKVLIYAISGTYGTDSIPTGAVLATSDNVNTSSLGTSFGLISFTFSGAQQITLTNGVHYFLVLELDGITGGGSDSISFGYDGSSPTAAGNQASYFSGAWNAINTRDYCFYAYKNDIVTTSTTTTTMSSTSTTTTSTSSTTTSTSTTTLPYIQPPSFFKIAKLGINALTTNNPKDLEFDSRYSTLKYYLKTTASISIDINGGNTTGTATIQHNLGYYPYVEVYLLNPNGQYEYCPGWNTGASTTWKYTYKITKTTIQLYIETGGFTTPPNSQIFYFTVFIFKNNLGF